MEQSELLVTAQSVASVVRDLQVVLEVSLTVADLWVGTIPPELLVTHTL
jgi:hypothetical protein